jgi:hypothetical protein
MVAYSFQKRFAEPIQLGTKCQTIRAPRKRHARPGEELQLYVGMRTKHCRLLGRRVCKSVVPVRLVFSRHGPAELFQVDGQYLSPKAMEIFARQDGFQSLEDMAQFWFASHGEPDRVTIPFRGVLIQWEGGHEP